MFVFNLVLNTRSLDAILGTEIKHSNNTDCWKKECVWSVYLNC